MDDSTKSNRQQGAESRKLDRPDDPKLHMQNMEPTGRGSDNHLSTRQSPSHGSPAVLADRGGTIVNSTPHADPATEIALREIAALDWQAEHHLRFTKEQEAILRQPVDPALVEIKFDGAVYMPGAWVRKVLNDAFGPGGWRILPLGKPLGDNNEYTMHCALIAEGRVVAVTYADYVDKRKWVKQSKGTIYESLCTDALTKCGKTLGIAEELWFPSWVRKWKKDYAEEVYDKQSEATVWRRRDDVDSYDIGKPGYSHGDEYHKPARLIDETQAHMDALRQDRRYGDSWVTRDDAFPPKPDEQQEAD